MSALPVERKEPASTVRRMAGAGSIAFIIIAAAALGTLAAPAIETLQQPVPGQAERAAPAAGAPRAPATAVSAHDPNDRDGDGLPDLLEIQLGTYLKNTADSDDDGVADKDEDANPMNGVVDRGETDPANPDTDGDGIRDGDELPGRIVRDAAGAPIVLTVNGSMGQLRVPVAPMMGSVAMDYDGDGIINGLDRDSDNDGVSDREELSGTYYPSHPRAQSNPYAADTDGDGLTDLQERQWATDPALENSDNPERGLGGDQWTDGEEILHGTDPVNPDSDRDGLPDGLSIVIEGPGGPHPFVEGAADADQDGVINALDADSDNDGLRDKAESDGNGIGLVTLPDAADSDQDRLSDGAEVNVFNTNPRLGDTDLDGIKDGLEVKDYATDPLNPDTDGDGVRDGDELAGARVRDAGGVPIDLTVDGSVVALVVPAGTPSVNDADGDGMINALDPDDDNDGVMTRDEVSGAGYAFRVEQARLGGGVRTNPYVADTDQDGLLDSYEARVSQTNPAGTDTDRDGITDYAELFTTKFGYPNGAGGVNETHAIMTDPHQADTDGDGVDDLTETRLGWNPINRDTDGDNINDGAAVTISYVDPNGATQTSSYREDSTDTDHDGLSNALDNSASVDFRTLSNNFRDRTKMAYAGWVFTHHPEWHQGPLNPGVLVLNGIPTTRDSDGDGVNDTDEIRAGSDPLDARVHQIIDIDDQDPDQDGLLTTEENVLGTNPKSADTDSDQRPDGRELDPFGVQVEPGLTAYQTGDVDYDCATNPMMLHSDGDGVGGAGSGDGTELDSGLDPMVADTDGDGLLDNVDTAPLLQDRDGDLLVDGFEDSNANGILDAGETDPDRQDSDADGMADGPEAYVWGTNPRDPVGDMDGDKLSDVAEWFTNRTDPRFRDTDLDALDDGFEINGTPSAHASGRLNPLARDSDGDYLVDGYEVLGGSAPSGPGTGGLRHTPAGAGSAQESAGLPGNIDASLGDSDGDGLMDCAEAALGMWKQKAGANPVSSITDERDEDADGVSDGAEAPGQRAADGQLVDLEALAFQARSEGNGASYVSNPIDADTDADGLVDGVEALAGTAPGHWDSDHDALADGVEDANQNGVVEAQETDPRQSDTDGDNLADGLENSKVTIVARVPVPRRERAGVPVYDGAYDLSNARDPDTDHDGVVDGAELGFAGMALRAGVVLPLGRQTDPKNPDSDRDGLTDGAELAAGTNPNESDTDKDQVVDGEDTQPLDKAQGGAVLNATMIGPATVDLALANTTLDGTTSFKVENGAPPLSKADPILDFYSVKSNFVRAGNVDDNYANPYACTELIESDWITLTEAPASNACSSLRAGSEGARTYTLSVSLPAGMIPGRYAGRVYFLASENGSHNLTRAIPIENACATSALAVPTLAVHSYVDLTIIVPPRFDLDILNRDVALGDGATKKDYGPLWGVGGSNPAAFYAGGAADNEMHLKGLAGHDGLLTGIFVLSNPNQLETGNVFNCQGWAPKYGDGTNRAKFDSDVQGNARFEHVGVRFVKGGGMTIPDGVVSFATVKNGQELAGVGGLDGFDLGAQDSVIVKVNTHLLPPGSFDGSIQVWRDRTGTQIPGEGDVLDSFVLRVETVSPDLDIAGGSLVGGKLGETVDLSKVLPIWSIQAAAVCNDAQNQAFNPADGPGTEGWQDLQVYNPINDARINPAPVPGMPETPIQLGPCAGDPPANATRFRVFRYDGTLPNPWDTDHYFDVQIWSCLSAADCGAANVLNVKVPSLQGHPVGSEIIPDGLYRPFYQEGSFDNGYVKLSTRGQATSFSRPDPTGAGYPVVYKGGDLKSSTWGYADRFEVGLQLVNPPCALTYTPGSTLDLGNVNTGATVSGSVVLHGCSTRAFEHLTPSGLILTRVAGGDQINASVAMAATSIPMDGQTGVTVTADAGTHEAGDYTGTLAISTGNPAETANLLVKLRINGPCIPTFAFAGHPVTTLPITMSTGVEATTDLGLVVACEKGLTNLAPHLSTLAGPGGEQITDATVSIDKTSAGPNSVTALHVTVSTGLHAAGTYTGTLTVTSTDPRETGTLAVELTIAPPCVPTFAIEGRAVTTLPIAMNTRDQGTTDLSLVVACEKGLTNLAPHLSTLTGPGGDQITDATVTIDRTAVEKNGSTGLHVTVGTGLHASGTYTGTLTVTSADPRETGTLAVELTIAPACVPTFSGGPIAFSIHPLVPYVHDLTISACALQALANLEAIISALSGPGENRITTASVRLDKVNLERGAGTLLHLTIPGESHAPGTYTGSITVRSRDDARASNTISVTATVLPPCGPSIATDVVVPATNPDHWGASSASVAGCGEPLSGLTASVSTLTRADGRDQITDALATIDATTLPVDGTTTVHVAVHAAAHLAGDYTGTIQVTAGNGQSTTAPVRFTVVGVPAFSVSASTIVLQDQDSKTVTVRNLGNTDLKGLAVTIANLPFVTATPEAADADWHGADAVFTIRSTPPGSQHADVYAGDVTIRSTGATDQKAGVVVTVTSRPSTSTEASVEPVAHGGDATFKINVTNAGNDDLSMLSVQLGDLAPVRVGGKPIPAPPKATVMTALAQGEAGSTSVIVHVAEGFFCGQYNAVARIIGQTASGKVTEEDVPVTLTVSGCETSPLAFSRNPARYSQIKNVDIAFASGGSVSVKIYNMYGVKVRELANRAAISGGRLNWDFKNDDGELVASGVYLVVADVDGKQFREKLLFVK